jgi:hypothetical protein
MTDTSELREIAESIGGNFRQHHFIEKLYYINIQSNGTTHDQFMETVRDKVTPKLKYFSVEDTWSDVHTQVIAFIPKEKNVR